MESRDLCQGVAGTSQGAGRPMTCLPGDCLPPSGSRFLFLPCVSQTWAAKRAWEGKRAGRKVENQRGQLGEQSVREALEP